MMTLQTLYDTKQITRTDFLAGKLYHQIRKRVLRSKSIQNSLHESSTHKLMKTKGGTIDPYQSAELEHFWDKLEEYFKFDQLKPLSILDFITGLQDAKTHMTISAIKGALKKMNKILKHTDIISIMRLVGLFPMSQRSVFWGRGGGGSLMFFLGFSSSSGSLGALPFLFFLNVTPEGFANSFGLA